jgi:hypothetical protein
MPPRCEYARPSYLCPLAKMEKKIKESKQKDKIIAQPGRCIGRQENAGFRFSWSTSYPPVRLEEELSVLLYWKEKARPDCK